MSESNIWNEVYNLIGIIVGGWFIISILVGYFKEKERKGEW